MSTKIHALVDALGNPVNFFLTGGEAHDLVGADHLLPSMQADTLIADKAFDADERVIAPLAAAGKTAVIPPKANRRLPRDYDQYIYQARPHDSPHSQMAPNICAKRGWAASIWANRLMSGSRRKSVMFGMSS